MKDLVIGCFTNYSFEEIECWVNSLDRCGFNGIKAVLCYDVKAGVVATLKERGYVVFGFKLDTNTGDLSYRSERGGRVRIVVDRFLHMPLFIRRLSATQRIRFVVATDVRDVVFQSNPVEWLQKNLGSRKINVACESIAYRNETWGNRNLLSVFGPLVHDKLKDRLIFNAGTLAGEFEHLCDLMTLIYLVSKGSLDLDPINGGAPDQAALNVLLSLRPYQEIVNFAMSEDGFAAQLGTTGSQVASQYSSVLVEPVPIIIDGQVCTSKGVPHALVHQYDRVPEIRKVIEDRFKNPN